MKTMISTLGLITLFLTPHFVWAGIKAQIRSVIREGDQTHVLQGTFYAQGDRLRLDQTMVGVSQSTIIDYFSKKVTVLIHDQKKFVDTELDDLSWRQRVMRGQIPNAEEAKNSGFTMKEIGKDKIEGYPCKVFMMNWQEGGQVIDLKMWLATGLEGGIPLKTETQTSWGLKQSSSLHAIEKKELDENLFSAPPDYGRSAKTIIGFEPQGN